MTTRREDKAVDDFSEDLMRIARKVDLLPNTIVRKVTLDIHSGLTLKTPVDTGRARASWNVSESAPLRSVPPEFPANPSRPTPPGATGAAIRKQQGIARSVTADNKIYVTSSLVYVPFLDRGSSQQAPQGMRDLTMAEVSAGVKQFLLT